MVQKFLDQHRFKRKAINNSGTLQVSLDQEISETFIGFTIGDDVWVDMRYSQKHDSFYWTVYPEGDQPSASELRQLIREVVSE